MHLVNNVGPGLRRGRTKVAQGTSVPTPEVEQPEPQEEVRDMPQASERTVLRAPRTRKRRRGARAQDLPDIDPIASFSKEVPSVPTTLAQPAVSHTHIGCITSIHVNLNGKSGSNDPNDADTSG